MEPPSSPSGFSLFCVGAACGRPLRAVFFFWVGADIIRPFVSGPQFDPLAAPVGAERPPNRPREGKEAGATALVEASTCSKNVERQRAARGMVSCPLPAPDGDTPPLDGSPVEEMGVRGRRDRALSNARKPPPAVFWFLLHRCKRNSPAGEILNIPLLFPVKRAGG